MIFTQFSNGMRNSYEPYEDLGKKPADKNTTIKVTPLLYNGQLFFNSETKRPIPPEEFEKMDLLYAPSRQTGAMEVASVEYIVKETSTDVVDVKQETKHENENPTDTTSQSAPSVEQTTPV